MSPTELDGAALRDLVAAQTGRSLREPWRVAARCSFGYPTVVVSPSVLDDSTRFPTWAWLTCPYLAEQAGSGESAGATAAWAARAASDPVLAEQLRALDAQVRAARRAEGAGADACADVGTAGQSDPLGVKCLHAHVAYALAGLDDPVGAEVLASTGRECADGRCARLVRQEAVPGAEEGGA